MFAYRINTVNRKAWLRGPKTYALKIPMDHAPTVHVDQSPRDVTQLEEPHGSQRQVRVIGVNGGFTSSNRFTSQCISTNWLIFPFGIHSDTMAKRFSVIITPSNGNTF